mmetsp:Transcript_39762/g.86667  ORF Transcript_39762/g.86667 Transcript_39762/m.86667 type:complete len:384 (+) Transcript_39762:588-1739(+)
MWPGSSTTRRSLARSAMWAASRTSACRRWSRRRPRRRPAVATPTTRSSSTSLADLATASPAPTGAIPTIISPQRSASLSPSPRMCRRRIVCKRSCQVNSLWTSLAARTASAALPTPSMINCPAPSRKSMGRSPASGSWTLCRVQTGGCCATTPSTAVSRRMARRSPSSRPRCRRSMPRRRSSAPPISLAPWSRSSTACPASSLAAAHACRTRWACQTSRPRGRRAWPACSTWGGSGSLSLSTLRSPSSWTTGRTGSFTSSWIRTAASRTTRRPPAASPLPMRARLSTPTGCSRTRRSRTQRCGSAASLQAPREWGRTGANSAWTPRRATCARTSPRTPSRRKASPPRTTWHPFRPASSRRPSSRPCVSWGNTWRSRSSGQSSS